MNDMPFFNIASVWQAITRRWKIITVFTLGMVGLAFFVLMIVPKYYKSTAVIIAANPALADKNRLLDHNIQHLYSPYGSGDDLNRLYAIAKLDTLKYQLVNEFDLKSYYELPSSMVGTREAVRALEQDIDLVKTENDELHITIMTRNKQLSANLANRLVQLIDSTAARSWRKEYERSLQALQQSIEHIRKRLSNKVDSVNKTSHAGLPSVYHNVLLQQQGQFELAKNEYQLAIENNPSSLIVLQSAFPSLTYDKPKKGKILVLSFLASLAFAVIAVLVYDRSKN